MVNYVEIVIAQNIRKGIRDSMAEFFRAQLDYVFFFYGLSLIILASVCFSLGEAEKRQLPWPLLGLFGVARGLHEWINLFTNGFGESPFWQGSFDSSPLVTTIQAAGIIVSFVLLAEFGRAGIKAAWGKGPGPWVLAPLTVLTILGAVAGGPALKTCLILGLIGGLWAALAMYAAAGKQGAAPRGWLLAGSYTIGLYALTISGEVFQAGFLELAGLPLQLVQGLLVISVAMAIRRYSLAGAGGFTGSEEADPKAKQITDRTIITVAIILGLGFAATQFLGGVGRDEVRQRSITRVKAIASHFITELTQRERAAGVIAGTYPLPAVLISGKPEDIQLANYLLDRYKQTGGADAVFLLDRTGRTVASSEWDNERNFNDKNYGSYSFFKKAVSGTTGRTFEDGIKNGGPAYYISFPVRDGQGRIIGVFGMMENIGYLAEEFRHDDIFFFVDDKEMIFLSSLPDKIGKSLRTSGKEAVISQAAVDDTEVVMAGRHYLVTRRALNQEGWFLVLLSLTSQEKGLRLFGIVITLCLSVLTLAFSVSLRRIRASSFRAAAARYEAQKKIERAERLASLGIMAAGIAHEINQPLNSLKIIVDSILYWHKKGKAQETGKIIEKLQTVSAQTDRIDEIIGHIRSFVRQDNHHELVPCNLNDAVEDALGMLGSQLKSHGIQVGKDLAATPPPVLGQPGRLEEVVVNLLVNAMQALDATDKPEKEILCATRTENGAVVMEISDNGAGISEEIKEKIFEPFFTTKGTGEGMGLGLSIAHSIVTAFNGQICAGTNARGGAAFVVRFPALPCSAK